MYCAILRVGIPVRLEIVELGQDEGVVGVPAGGIEVGLDQIEAMRLEIGRPRLASLLPRLGIGGLGVPPHRVVVKVGDHEHLPAGLLDHDLKGMTI